MAASKHGRTLWIGLALAVLTPTIVFVAVGLGKGMGIGEVFGALIEQSGGRKQNPLIAGTAGVFPIGILALALRVGRRFNTAGPPPAAAWGGVLAVLAVLVWANVTFWPLFLPDRVYPGFPHGLELVLGPLFYAPIAMILGFLGGWVAGARRS